MEKSKMPPRNKFSLIRARLILAQKLLEESDTLPGVEGYNFENMDNWYSHERHEREALVVYLLLTCFDLLGQSQPHIDFMKWLTKKDPEFAEERRIAQETIRSKNGDIIDQARGLLEYYNKHYGAKTAFYSGIEQLPVNAKNQLLSTIYVEKRDPRSLLPENRNTSFASIPLENGEKKYKQQRDYIYGLRNSFTHQLSQLHFSSSPMMSAFPHTINLEKKLPSNGASWGISIFDGKIIYGVDHTNQDEEYVYKLKDWPFVLFEVLYAAIGEEFDRTTIKLKFFILSSEGERPFYYSSVEHALVNEVLKRELDISSR